eukprot:2878998-Pyramimonas_sp.AAC.1
MGHSALEGQFVATFWQRSQLRDKMLDAVKGSESRAADDERAARYPHTWTRRTGGRGSGCSSLGYRL